MDRLSELPDSLILRILSFLNIEDVIPTTFLSKRWNNLWTTIPSLIFRIDMSDEQRIQNFVNQVLMLWREGRIHKFEVDIRPDFNTISLGDHDVDSWVLFAVERKVEELSIHLVYDDRRWVNAVPESKEEVYWAPPCLFSCSSLKKLSLVGCNIEMHESPLWNQLESLTIDGYCFSQSTMDSILRGSPRLEALELRFMETYEDLRVFSTSLKKLKIDKYTEFDVYRPARDTVLRIRCENLEELKLSGGLFCKALFTDLSVLKNVILDFYDFHDCCVDQCYDCELLGDTLKQIISTIHRVERLELSNWCVKVLGTSQMKYKLSPLQNVWCLKLNADGGDCFSEFREIANILNIFPHVKNLALKHWSDAEFKAHHEDLSEHETNLSEAFSQLIIVDIHSNLSSSSILGFIKLLLKHAVLLEKCVIRAHWSISYDTEHWHRVVATLKNVSKFSPTAEVLFCLDYF